MLYHLKMAQIEPWPNPKFTGTGKVNLDIALYDTRPVIDVPRDEYPRTEYSATARATINPISGIVDVNFTIPAQVAQSVVAAKNGAQNDNNITNDIRFHVRKEDVWLDYENDFERLHTIQLYVPWLQGVDYGDNWQVWLDPPLLDFLHSITGATFMFDDQSRTGLAAWLDHIYENRMSPTPAQPESPEPTEDMANALPDEDGSD